VETRQDHESKRRRVESSNKNGNGPPDIRNATGPSPALGLNGPARNDFSAKADSIGLGATPTTQSKLNTPAAAQALAGSNRDVVANRAAIRLANMSAAEVLKAELAGLVPVKSGVSSIPVVKVQEQPEPEMSDSASDFEVPGLGNVDPPPATDYIDTDVEVEASPSQSLSMDDSMMSVLTASSGRKRKLSEVEAEGAQIDAEDVVIGEDESSAEEEEPSYAMVVRADGTVEQVDNVRYGGIFYVFLVLRGRIETLYGMCRLYEPGYKERYYQQKFGVPSSNAEFKKTCVIFST
jgi:5'-3' exoribonuclease 2